jgi:SPP1 gp7 family putative phage head morphogenesis protein
MWAVSSDPVKFEEALAYWRGRVPLTKTEFDALTAAAKTRAFTLAGVAQLDVIAEVMQAIERALEEGTGIEQFRTDIGAKLEAAWGASNPGRIELIFRNAVQRSYSAGRYAQMTDPQVIKARPYWRFDAVLDSRTSPICKPLNGTILPADSPFWQSNYPPLHHHCRSGVYSLTDEQASSLGGEDDLPDIKAADGFGAAPGSGGEWTPSEDDYPTDVWKAYQKKGGP